MVLAELEKDWGSHLPVLIKLMAKTTGNVLEVGTGAYSTPFLHWACFLQNRDLTSVEDSEEYLLFAKKFEADFHKILNEIPNSDNWSIVFIDSFPLENRLLIAKNLSNRSRFIIIHDTTPDEFGGIFKYRFDYTKIAPTTSVFSNFIDVNKLEI